MQEQKIAYSGIKPTGQLHIGHLIGAARNWKAYEDEYKCLYNVADLHSITIDITPASLRADTYGLFAMFLALGLNPDKSTIFVQSHVPAHAELAWVLNCYTQFGEARRMTQFKDKSQKTPHNVNVGLFDYPVLMAADILLYQADLVPIGKDQKQHLELARTIAERFNNKYSPTFVVPKEALPKYGEKICSLTDPVIKMSKSDENLGGVVMLLDKPDDIMRKFKKAVTDSGDEIIYSPTNKAGISNLLTIYAALKNKTMKEAENVFKGMSYAEFKEAVAQTVIDELTPLQKRYYELYTDKEYLSSLMKKGAEEAAYMARKTLSKVYRKVGFVQL